MADLKWFKSSHSAGPSGCVEIAFLEDGGTAVRDTKQQGAGPVLTFTAEEWTSFVAGAKGGEFDRR